MREINVPTEAALLAPICKFNQETALLLWIALHSKGTVLDIGCGTGGRAKAFAFMLARFKRSIVGFEWSQEHRIDEKQKRRKYMRRDIMRECNALENVTARDMDPSTVCYEEYQPIGMAIVDYDYTLSGLKKITAPLMECVPMLATPNAAIAWTGYEGGPDVFGDVVMYLESLAESNMYHFTGTKIAFKVFNPSEQFRKELLKLSNFV